MTTQLKGAYDLCLKCRYLGDGCDGPNTLSMTLDRWCEWCKDLKKVRSLTNADISEQSGISLTTIDRIMAGNAPKDIKRSTASDINRVLVGSEGQWPCAMAIEAKTPDALKELNRKDSELAELRKMLSEIHSSYEKELEIVRQGARTMKAEAQAKIDHLKEEIEHLKAEARTKSKLLEKLMDAK